MEFIDYYKILELTNTASETDIKKAYRKLARKFHPDLHPNDANANKKFQEINEANEVLSDPEKRMKYDKYGKDWKHAGEMGPTSQQHREQQWQEGSDIGGDDFSSFFESMFGSQGGARHSQARFRGQDLSTELHLQLEDIYKTEKKVITINGKKIGITIPAGVENGQQIKLSGHGAPGSSDGPAGDLYITFIIENHPRFKREGNNLLASVKLDLYTAILGGDILVDTFDGKVKLKVPPETQTGTKVKLKGKGFPVYKKDREFGDLYITYQVKLPANISEKEKELFSELSKLRNHDN